MMVRIIIIIPTPHLLRGRHLGGASGPLSDGGGSGSLGSRGSAFVGNPT
jgi:hypothetical protein